jgi:hypothetical protein
LNEFFVGVHVRFMIQYVPIVMFWSNGMRGSPLGVGE